jgi:hypothetical protein
VPPTGLRYYPEHPRGDTCLGTVRGCRVLMRLTLERLAVRWSVLPTPRRRTFAPAFPACAHSDLPALRHPVCAGQLTPAPGPWAPPPVI